MTVRAGERKEGKLQVLNLSLQLATYTLQICRNEKVFPKSQRWIMTQRIVNECLDAVTCIRRANAVLAQDEQSIAYRRAQQKDYLRYCRKAIADYLAAIGLTLNRKTNIAPLKQGVKYLQWRFVLTDTGKVLMLLGCSKFARQRRRMRKLWTMECKGEVAQGATRESLQAFLAHAARGNTYRQCRRIKQYYKNLTGRCFE